MTNTDSLKGPWPYLMSTKYVLYSIEIKFGNLIPSILGIFRLHFAANKKANFGKNKKYETKPLMLGKRIKQVLGAGLVVSVLDSSIKRPRFASLLVFIELID